MTLLLLSQLRFLWRAPWSLATAIVGVSLGVASIVAVHLISAEVDRSLTAAVPPHLAGLTHLIDGAGLDADDYFELRATWRREGWPELLALVPLLEGRIRIAERPVRVLGTDLLAGGWSGTGGGPGGISGDGISGGGTGGDGAATTGTDDFSALLRGDAVFADRALGLATGDALRLGDRDRRIAGVVDSGAGAALFVDIGLAQRLLGAPEDALSQIGIRVRDPWEWWRRVLDRLMPGIAALLPPPPAPQALHDFLATRASAAHRDAPAQRLRPVSDELQTATFARSVLFNLGALGLLALVVAWFLIYQVAVIWLRRQQLLLDYLHLLGVSANRLRGVVLLLFLALGVLASGLGILGGAVLARLLVDVSLAGLGTPVPELPLDGWVLQKALLSGLGVCVLGGSLAYARQRAPESGHPWRRVFALVLLLALAAAGIGAERSGIAGGFLAILASSLVVVTLVAPLLAALRRAASGERPGLLWRLGLREASGHPRVLSAALAALALALATSIGMALMVESFRLDFTRLLETRLAGDLYLSGDAAAIAAAARYLDRDAFVTGSAAESASVVPGTAAIRTAAIRGAAYGSIRSRANGLPVELGYGRFDARESARYGYPQPLAVGAALISEPLARALGVAPGATLTIEGQPVRVAAVFADFGEAVPRVLVDVATLDALRVTPRFDRLTVDVTPGAAAAELARELARRFPALEIGQRDALRERVLAVFDQTFAVTRALTLLALAVAAVGMYSALTALRLIQAPTLRLLHAQGLLPRELAGIALIRSGTVGALALLLALPLGIAMAWMLCAVINPRSFGWTIALQFPVSAWLPPLLAGFAAALLAGLLPAPREQAGPGE